VTRAAGERGRRAETALRGILQAGGYVVIRSAASKCLDLIAVDVESVSGLEVKSTRDDVLYVSRTRRQRDQHEDLVRINEETVCGTAYVVRWEPEGVYEVFSCYDTIMRKGHGVTLETVFPCVRPVSEAAVRFGDVAPLRSAPNNPPIVPREHTTQAEEREAAVTEHLTLVAECRPETQTTAEAAEYMRELQRRPRRFPELDKAPIVYIGRDGQGGGTD